MEADQFIFSNNLRNESAIKDFSRDFDPKQSIQITISPSAKDLSNAFDYDCFSRTKSNFNLNVDARSSSTELGVSSDSIHEHQGIIVKI